MKVRKIVLSLALLSLFGGCSSDDVYTNYSRYKANFSYGSVITATPLKDALNSPGIFCTITLGVSTLDFRSLTLSYSDPITASTMYYQKIICISGFIVGKSNDYEMGADELNLVCYDLACSNCHHNDAINRNLELREFGFAYCQRCKRKYNLNSHGLIVEGDAGRPLERYHISYDGANRMAVWN